MTKEKIRQYYRYFVVFYVGALCGSVLTRYLGDWVVKYDPLVVLILVSAAVVTLLAERYVGRFAKGK